MNKTTNIIASHFAIVTDVPEMNPNPNTEAMIATIKKTIAHPNKPDNPFLSIVEYSIKVIVVYNTMFYSLGKIYIELLIEMGKRLR